MTNNDDLAPMRLAIEASRAALAAGDMPFGAALVAPDGRVLLVSANRQSSGADCTAHAETVLVRDAQAQLGLDALRGATVYASGEPCAMCSGAMFWAGVGRVVFAASQAQIASALGGPLLPLSCSAVLSAAQPAVAVAGGVLADEALQVLLLAGRATGAAAT